MTNISGVVVHGPLEPYAAGFAAELSRLGYTPGSAQHELRLMAHLSRWLGREGLELTQLTTPVAEAFLVARREAGYTVYRSMRGMGPLLIYLRSCGAPGPSTVTLTPAEALLERYRAYLTGERGLSAASAARYVTAVRDFVTGRVDGEEKHLSELSASEVTAFVLEVCGRGQPGKAKTTVTALRSVLGFLHLEGIVGGSLAAAVPAVASWRLAELPRGLERGEVERLLGACDRRSEQGRRDLAIILLLVRLGLRAGEVAALALDDIDWRSGEITIRGKGDRRERLPLPDDVGTAIVAYLQHGRSGTAQGRAVFVRRKAPHRGLSSEAVSMVVAAASERAGLGTVRAHRLRHTAATHTLAAGAPLPEIGQLLRHRKAASTAIYAKTDRKTLRTLARPWPGGGAA